MEHIGETSRVCLLSLRRLSARLISQISWIAQDSVQLGFENIQGWDFLSIPGHLVPCYTTVCTLLMQLAVVQIGVVFCHLKRAKGGKERTLLLVPFRSSSGQVKGCWRWGV